MRNTQLVKIINYLFIFLVINYSLLVNFVFHIDKTGYGLIFLSVLVLVINAKDFKTIQLSKPVVFWLIWCFFVVFNYAIHDHSVNPMNVLGLFRRVFIPLITMTVVIKEYRHNDTGFLWLCAIAFLFYTAIGYYFDRGILYRVEGDENVLGNTYAITVSLGLFFFVLLQKQGKLKMVIWIALAAVIMLVLAMSGTRKAFGVGIILLAFWALSMINRRKIGSWVVVVAFFIVGLYGYNYLIENTFMGERLEMIEEQGDIYLPPDAPKALTIFGDRAPHYYYGWQMFKKHPLLGVGLVQSRVGQGRIFVYIHSEYMVQLTDNGIVGFMLFVLLYYWVGKKLLKKLKKHASLSLCCIGGFVALLFMELTAWVWDFSPVFIVLGVLIAYGKYDYEDEKDTLCSVEL